MSKAQVVKNEENRADEKNIYNSRAKYTRKDRRPALAPLQDVAISCNDYLSVNSKVQVVKRSKSISEPSTRNGPPKTRQIPFIKEPLNPLRYEPARPKSSNLQTVQSCHCKKAKSLGFDVSAASSSKRANPKSITNSLQSGKYTELYQLGATPEDRNVSLKRSPSHSQEWIKSTVHLKYPKTTKASITQSVSREDRSIPDIRIHNSTLINCVESQNVNEDLESRSSNLSPDLEMLEQCRNIQYTREFSELPNEDTSFQSASRYFDNNFHAIQPKFVKSPITLNIPLRRSSNISEKFETCNIKKLIARRKLKSRREIRDSFLHPIIYNAEYIEDIVQYFYTINSKFILSVELVEQRVHKSVRSSIVNWLMQINEIFTSSNSDVVFFTAVRLFDWIVIALKLRNTGYQLAAIASYWISTKYLDNLTMKIPKLFALCDGKYSKSEILSMEINILQKIKFCLDMTNPLDFLYYYLNTFSFEDIELLEYAARFIIDCCCLFETFMIKDSSFVAAASLVLAYKTICRSQQLLLTFKRHKIAELEAYANKVLVTNIRYSILANYEPISKYSNPEKRNVYQYFSCLL
ncbi:uncharacterized protein LOC132705619 isoform X2 [Cylas formicarius]|uniref:uncharacterized protein LOC132705619 isoform X2 n=1 Tax=Cylas formicarius TaxID=197179 RepID=UPI0029583E62|nr:uncharacterized protein LOC132705619 isoform X2 [Cylas formicarius]